MTLSERVRYRFEALAAALVAALRDLRTGFTMLPIAGADGEGEGGEGAGEGGKGGGEGSGEEGEPSGEEEPETFDRKYVEKLRRENAEARTKKNEAEERAKQYEDRDKTEQEKAGEKAAEAEKRADSAEANSLRLDVALDKAPEGMSMKQVRKLAKRLSGSNREELEADAEELFADFAPEGDGGDQGSRRRPQERMRPGAAPSSEPEETDPKKLAEQVPRL